MKVFLISANTCTDPYPVYPLGMAVVAGALEQAGHPVKCFDCAASGIETAAEHIRNQILSFQPKLIGLSLRNIDTVNSVSDAANLLAKPLEIAHRIKALFPHIPLVLGGPAFTILPDPLMKLSGADFGISGEGEVSLVELADAIARNAPPPGGVIQGKPGMNAGALYPEEIARHYYDTTHILPLQTKRGCSFRCAYCTYPALEGNTFRARDTHSIARELHELKARFPDVLVYFVDAVFNDPDGLFRDLLQTMIDQQCDVPFAAFLSPFRLDHADIDQMRRAGMICAELGIDASNDDALRGLNKAFSFQEAKNSCELLRRADISVTTNLIFGGPRETPATVRRGIDNVLSLGEVYSMIFSGVRILPKTPLWNLAKNEQKLPANWNGVDELYYFADGLDRETLDQTLRNAFEGNPYCIYPPHSRRKELQEIHKLGYVKLRALQRGGSQRTTVAPGEGGRPA